MPLCAKDSHNDFVPGSVRVIRRDYSAGTILAPRTSMAHGGFRLGCGLAIIASVHLACSTTEGGSNAPAGSAGTGGAHVGSGGAAGAHVGTGGAAGAHVGSGGAAGAHVGNGGAAGAHVGSGGAAGRGGTGGTHEDAGVDGSLDSGTEGGALGVSYPCIGGEILREVDSGTSSSGEVIVPWTESVGDCIAGQTYCYIRSGQKSLNSPPTRTCEAVPAACRAKPNCACLCSHGVNCQYSNCSCKDDGLGRATYACVQI